MKLHTGPCQFPDNSDLMTVLAAVLKGTTGKLRPKVIVETGTHHGLGSTQFLIKSIEKFKWENPRADNVEIITIEIDEQNFLIAQSNLKDHSFIKVIHGCSVDADKAREFIENDKMILEHEKYPDIFIDSLDDPVGFYLHEIQGKRFNYGKGGRDNILMKLIHQVYDKRPIFLLDSAGGIGYLEFQTVTDGMKNHEFHVILDDITHVKHYRSAAYIRQCNWPILYENERCMLAKHPGSTGRPCGVPVGKPLTKKQLACRKKPRNR